MKYTTDTYNTKDGEKLFYYYWQANSAISCKGIVQISHGIGEHAARYQRLAELLQKDGYHVYANDHRAHGKSVKTKQMLGFYDGDNYFDAAVEDMYQFTALIKKAHPNKKMVLFGHSMGSLLSRKYVTVHRNEVQGLILSGTASYMKGLGFAGMAAAKIVRVFNGRVQENKFLREVFFGEFNKKFKPNRTKLDWISSDEKQVDIFEADPYRIEDFSLGIFMDILTSSKYINSKEAFNTTSKQLPIYLFSGDKDPVGEMGKGVEKVYKQYKKAGVEDLSLKIYKGGRHEMLNETNHKEVEQDFLDWINKTIKK